MDFEQAINRLDPQVYLSLRTALELGKWPDGRRLSEAQKKLCMEAVIRYEHARNIPEQDRVGYIDRDGCGRQGEAEPLRFLN